MNIIEFYSSHYQSLNSPHGLMLQPIPDDCDIVLEQIEVLHRLSTENRTILEKILEVIDAKFNTMSNVSLKDYQGLIDKSQRPSFIKKYGRAGIRATRDYLRAKIVLQDLNQTMDILRILFDESHGISCVKVETNTMINPKGNTGWRIATFDLQMPNGQIIELYFIIKELQWAKRGAGHHTYEQLRRLGVEDAEIKQRLKLEGKDVYDRGWKDYLERINKTEQQVEIDWLNTELEILNFFQGL